MPRAAPACSRAARLPSGTREPRVTASTSAAPSGGRGQVLASLVDDRAAESGAGRSSKGADSCASTSLCSAALRTALQGRNDLTDEERRATFRLVVMSDGPRSIGRKITQPRQGKSSCCAPWRLDATGGSTFGRPLERMARADLPYLPGRRQHRGSTASLADLGSVTHAGSRHMRQACRRAATRPDDPPRKASGPQWAGQTGRRSGTNRSAVGRSGSGFTEAWLALRSCSR